MADGKPKALRYDGLQYVRFCALLAFSRSRLTLVEGRALSQLVRNGVATVKSITNPKSRNIIRLLSRLCAVACSERTTLDSLSDSIFEIRKAKWPAQSPTKKNSMPRNC